MADTATLRNPAPTVRAGDLVEVRNRFDGAWAGGFVVDAVEADGRLRIRRLSDGRVLPATFALTGVRRRPPAA
jgi:hypothetical protein